MRPRSIVFDLFGDYVRHHGGAIRLRSLTRLLEPFGVGESTLRVVMARLRREGWFDTRREGRETVYLLNERSSRLLAEGRERIFERSATPWDGTWFMVIYSVPEPERALREQLRKELAWRGFGPLAPSTWVSPHDRLDDLAQRFAGHPALRLDLLRASSAGVAVDREMAARCWDLTALDADYARLLRRLRPLVRRLRSGRGRAGSPLVERTQLISDYRHFPFRDPDLPAELLPKGWRGREAHALFVEAHELLRAGAEEQFLRLTAGR